MRHLSFATVLIAGIATTAAHASITGNPSADGWTLSGNSMNNGDYIRGAGNFSYDMYHNAYTLQSGSALLGGAGSYAWQVGDRVLAIGGVFRNNDGVSAGWGSAFTGAGVNSNITASGDNGESSMRIVAKFGTDAASWSPSTVKPGSGNGNGSSSSGHGGLGAVLISNQAGNQTTLDPAQAGIIQTCTVATQYTGSEIDIDGAVGKYITTWVDGLPATFEIFLNLDVLAANHAFTDYPQIGDRADMAIQRSSGVYTDGLLVVPSAGSLALMGLSGLLVTRRRR